MQVIFISYNDNDLYKVLKELKKYLRFQSNFEKCMQQLPLFLYKLFPRPGRTTSPGTFHSLDNANLDPIP